MTERLMVVLAVSACDHVISVTGPTVAGVHQGGTEEHAEPNVWSGGSI